MMIYSINEMRSAKDSCEKSFLFAGIYPFFHLFGRFFVVFLFAKFVGFIVVLQSFLKVSHFFEGISKPSIGNRLLFV